MASTRLILPALRAPRVTAGFRWPPEMASVALAMTAIVSPWARAIATRPGWSLPMAVPAIAPTPTKMSAKVPMSSAVYARKFIPGTIATLRSVSVRALPDSALAFRDARLEDITPFYEGLAARPFDGDAEVEAWLADWSRLEALFAEAHNEASTAYDRDTTDPAKEAADLRFSADISPRLEAYRVKLGERLVASGFSRPDLEPPIARWRNRIDLFREANVPLIAEEQKLVSRYSKVTAALTVEWEGQRLVPPQLRPYTNSADRALRERAYRAFFEPFIDARDELADIFDGMYELRQEQARNAGFENYRDYMHRAKNRFDYTVEDTLRFQESVAATVVPAVDRIYQRRARQMELDRDLIKPWDAMDSHVGNPDPLGRPALRPFATEGDLMAKAQRVFESVDPLLGDYFGRLVGN